MHPMMVMLNGHGNGNGLPMSPVVSPLNVGPPKVASTTSTVASNTTAGSGSEDEVLRSLLLQYASLREKITKLKDGKEAPIK